MGIAEIIFESLREAITPKRFLPFFLLYFLFFIGTLIFANSFLQVMSPIILGGSTESGIAIAMLDMVALFIISILLVGVNLWFVGALIFSIYKKKDFKSGLSYSRKVFLNILLVSIILFLLYLFSGIFGNFSILVRLLIDWIFMFSLVSVIVKGDNLQKALTRSYQIVRKNILKSLVFYILTIFIALLILFLGLFLVGISIYPLLLNLIEILPADLQTLTSGQIVMIMNIIFGDYTYLVIASVIASLFMSFANVFVISSRTQYFLSFKKK